MGFYNNIFSAAYYFYKENNSKAPRYASACVVAISQILLLLVLLGIIKKLEIVDVFKMLKNMYLSIPIMLIWLFMVYFFYSTAKTEKILKEFDSKSEKIKYAWNILAVLSVIFPIIANAVLALN